MGREVRRVPVGFDWPLNKPWEGFLLPDRLDELPCPEGDACRNGMTAAGAWVMSMASLTLMLDEDIRAQSRQQPLHPYLRDVPTYSYGCRPSQDIIEFGTGLAGREAGFMGHDAIDTWRAYEKLVEAAGLDTKKWGYCPACQGCGSAEAYPGQRADAEAWEPTDPPEGESWQLWETVSEGSPISPAFETPDELARHIGGDFEKTLAWVTGVGWAPSGIASAGTFLTSTDISQGATL